MWWRSIIALFLVVHGLVYTFLDPESWLFHGGQGLFLILGTVAAAALSVGAIVLVARPESWRTFTAPGAAVSLAQLLLFFERGLFIGVVIDVAILAAVAWKYRRVGRETLVKLVSPALHRGLAHDIDCEHRSRSLSRLSPSGTVRVVLRAEHPVRR